MCQRQSFKFGQSGKACIFLAFVVTDQTRYNYIYALLFSWVKALQQLPKKRLAQFIRKPFGHGHSFQDLILIERKEVQLRHSTKTEREAIFKH